MSDVGPALQIRRMFEISFFLDVLVRKPNRVDWNYSAANLRDALIMAVTLVELFDRRRIYKNGLVQHRGLTTLPHRNSEGGLL